jgi:cysteine synthase
LSFVENNIRKNTLDLIGRTPMIRLEGLINRSFSIYAKLEYLNPGGSVKDRAALRIITDAFKEKRLTQGQLVVEMTSGNMGSGLAVVCKQFGNPFIAVMPKGNSPERIKILKALGAEVFLTEQVDGKDGMVTGKDIEFASGAARSLAADRNGFYVDQFNNQSGVRAHFDTTGPEILTDMPEIDAFVTSIGSGGTFTGVAGYLKSTNEKIKCIAVEPENAAILKTGKVLNPRHIIQGTGYGLVPPHWKSFLCDEIITVSDAEAGDMTRRLCHEFGLYAGYSSGANVAAAIKFGISDNSIRNIVTILCDTGYKYSDI